MDDAAFWHRLQFAFTITYHYLFPQLTMGLAWFLVYWKWRALRTGEFLYVRNFAPDRWPMGSPGAGNDRAQRVAG